jgi:hypothetical protein
MTVEDLHSEVCAALAGTYLEGCFSIDDGTVYFRYDTDDNTAKENESEYYDIQEYLQDLGYQIDMVCIEHDCISGDIIRAPR